MRIKKINLCPRIVDEVANVIIACRQEFKTKPRHDTLKVSIHIFARLLDEFVWDPDKTAPKSINMLGAFGWPCTITRDTLFILRADEVFYPDQCDHKWDNDPDRRGGIICSLCGLVPINAQPEALERKAFISFT